MIPDASPVVVIDVDDDALNDHGALRDLESPRHLRQKPAQYLVALYADHRVSRTTHTRIRHVCGALCQYSLVGGLNMRMTTHDG